MVQYLILVKITDHALFARYIQGSQPTIAQFGGRVIFHSIENALTFGANSWDVVAIQEWPSTDAYDRCWNSEEYKPWAKIRDTAADMTIIQCRNSFFHQSGQKKSS